VPGMPVGPTWFSWTALAIDQFFRLLDQVQLVDAPEQNGVFHPPASGVSAYNEYRLPQRTSDGPSAPIIVNEDPITILEQINQMLPIMPLVGDRNEQINVPSIDLTTYLNLEVPTTMMGEADFQYGLSRFETLGSVLQVPETEMLESVMATTISNPIESESLVGSLLCDPLCPVDSQMSSPTHMEDTMNSFEHVLRHMWPLLIVDAISGLQIELVPANNYE